jgi:hypothetical protein
MKMTRIELGRMGAKTLNSDPEKKAAAAKKAAATITQSRPNFYSTIGKLGALKKKEKNRGAAINA